MVDGRLEEHRWRDVGVVIGKGKAELEREAGVGSIIGALDRGSPGEQVAVSGGKGRDARGGGCHELHQFGLESKECQLSY